MPPKANKKKGAAAAEDEGEKPVEVAVPTERELLLTKQLEDVTTELKTTRERVDGLKQENEFLHQEAQQIRVETHEYLNYVSKKTQKRQDAVISLSDRNAEKISEIQAKKEEAIAKYNAEREKLGAVILSKESELTNIQNELAELHEFQVLQREQKGEISTLEKKMSEIRIKHNEAVQRLKGNFLEEKNTYQKQSEDELTELTKEAKKDAQQCLNDHTVKIKQENRTLRKELLELIQKTRALHHHKLELEEQRKVLLREQDYTDDLQKIRQQRTDDLFAAHGIEG